MIKMNRFSVATAVVAPFLFVLSSCSEKEVTPQKAASPKVETAQEKVSDEVTAQFVKLGFDVNDIKFIADANPLTGGSGKNNYLLEGDIVITPENLQAMLGSNVHHTGAVNEQYRTTNLVSGSPGRTIRVLGFNDGNIALDPKMIAGLRRAIANYNDLGAAFGLRFTLSFGIDMFAKDIVVYKSAGDAGGVAGFPVGGNPYRWVQIYSGTSAQTLDVIEHVITHEIGHCLGLRHTDWFNRSLSCGSGGNEGLGSEGAIHIAGTPIGYDASSVMVACFNSTKTGEFGNFDRIALQNLY